MSKFNISVDEPSNRTINHMGAKAFIQSPEMELISLVLTTFVQDSYYRKENDTVKRLKELLEQVDPLFAAKSAIFARKEFGMRSISHVIAGELANKIKGKSWAKKFYRRVVRRVDDIAEIYSYYMNTYGKDKVNSKGHKVKVGVPSCMKEGLRWAFNKFDNYQLGKYRMDGKQYPLSRLQKLFHPTWRKETIEFTSQESGRFHKIKENATALEQLIKGELKAEGTWNQALTATGEKETEEERIEAKKEVWKDLIENKKIGYFALVRNLCNIIEQSPETIPAACTMLENKELVQKSLLLPFRFISAYQEVVKLMQPATFEKEAEHIKQVLASLGKALTYSIDNLPELPGKTLILVDNSGSMTGDGGGHSLLSKMSNVKTSDIANLFAVLYWMKAENTLVGLFGDKIIYPQMQRELGVFENFKIIDEYKNQCGGATEAGIFEMFRTLLRDKIHVDRIIVFSDSQIGEGCNWYGTSERVSDFNALFESYKGVNPNFICYSVDLKGYGSTVFNQNVYKVAGWSEKIFDIIKILEQDKDALINKVKAIQL